MCLPHLPVETSRPSVYELQPQDGWKHADWFLFCAPRHLKSSVWFHNKKTKNTRRQLWLISAGSIFWEGLFDISASRWAYVCVQTIAKMKKAWGNGIAPTLYSALDCLGTVLEKWALRGISCCFRVPITFRPILSWFCRDENIKL